MVNNSYFIETVTEPAHIIQLLEDKIYQHNSIVLNKDDGRLFSKIVRDEHGNIIAGIGGWTWAGICEITQLWVDETVRKNGIGKMLLEAAEAEAKSKACNSILVRSYSFQAPLFYQKNGYKVAHVMPDFPEGYSYFILTKTTG